MSPSAGIILVVIMQLVLISLSFAVNGSSVVSYRTLAAHKAVRLYLYIRGGGDMVRGCAGFPRYSF